MLEYGMTSKGMTNMNFLSKNIVAGIWALILGEVLAYCRLVFCNYGISRYQLCRQNYRRCKS